jgi:hypothetical protein
VFIAVSVGVLLVVAALLYAAHTRRSSLFDPLAAGRSTVSSLQEATGGALDSFSFV